jgi:hypothetical protein
MRSAFAIALLGLSLVSGHALRAVEPPDSLAARKEFWQGQLNREFRFSDDEASMMYSLSQYRGGPKLHMVFDPAKWWEITYRFVREDKGLFEFQGHRGSVFRSSGNVLYFAHFSPSTCGCTITAHDLTTGKKLWETPLGAMGKARHSKYSNRVTMALAGSEEGKDLDEGVVWITGREEYGDYMEILDRRTGSVLAHKIFAKR